MLNDNSGSVSVSVPPAAQPGRPAGSRKGPSESTPQSSVLVLSSRGEAVLEVSMHLRTGRMQLRLPVQQVQSLGHESSAALLLKKVTVAGHLLKYCFARTPRSGAAPNEGWSLQATHSHPATLLMLRGPPRSTREGTTPSDVHTDRCMRDLHHWISKR